MKNACYIYAPLFRPPGRFRHRQEGDAIMSMHTSLKSGSKIAAKRNVLKRFERIDLLRKKGKWKEGDRAYNLPKVKTT